MGSFIVEQRRGFAVEGTHLVDAVAVNAAGDVVREVGDDPITTFRSAAKPFQLEVSLGGLAASERAGIDTADLAIGAASHHGEGFHVTHVRSLLERLGRDESHLFCGSHAPMDPQSAHELAASGGRPCPLHDNCSGKHSFMAAAAHAQGWAQDYRSPEHPLQQRIAERVNSASGGRVVGLVTDGCGLPCFVMPLSAMAQAWARIARAMAAPAGTTALGDIARAMQAYPLLMSGTRAFDGWLNTRAPVVAKVGAGGLLCVAIPAAGVGIAMKVASGVDAVRPVAAVNLLERWFPGLVGAALPERYRQVTGASGAVVGEIRARHLPGSTVPRREPVPVVELS